MRQYTPLAVILLALGCGSSAPTAPTETRQPPAAVQLDGTWTGVYRETDCTSTSMGTCSRRFTTGAPTMPFTLVVAQRGSAVNARFAEVLQPGRDGTLDGPVDGAVSGLQLRLDGTLVEQSRFFPDLSWSAVFRAQSLASDAAGLHITGTFTLIDLDVDGHAWMQRTCEIVRLERSGP